MILLKVSNQQVHQVVAVLSLIQKHHCAFGITKNLLVRLLLEIYPVLIIFHKYKKLLLFNLDCFLKFEERLHRDFLKLKFFYRLLLLFKKYLNHINRIIVSISLYTNIFGLGFYPWNYIINLFDKINVILKNFVQKIFDYNVFLRGLEGKINVIFL